MDFHLIFRNSEDTVLLMLNEIYGADGILSDKQLQKQEALSSPQQQRYDGTQVPMSTISLS